MIDKHNPPKYMKNIDSNFQIFKVSMVGSHYRLINTDGADVGTKGVNTLTRRKAYNSGQALKQIKTKTGGFMYRLVNMSEYSKLVSPISTTNEVVETTVSHTDIKDFIHNQSVDLKPKSIVISDLKWKYLIRSAVRAKNIMMTGPAGCGKTMAAKALVNALKRPDFYFNLGATQDARATLVGNTHFDSARGTFFSQSAFVKAITTENAVILLDELSRAHPDAWNILMTVLDEGQRYLRLDEAEGSPIIKVANGVTFIGTANIGNEYTSTRVMDRAILDRFTTIEMDVLTDVQEFGLLKYMFPEVDDYELKAIAEIAHHTREISKGETAKLTNMVSTRASVETAGLVYDGFSLVEAAEISILPFFSSDGGVDSERTYILQLIQKYNKPKDDKKLFGSVPKKSKPDDDVVEW
jgi:nitric oxide reductase NorQ protein